ncbi:MAG: hypothetical protein A2Y38_02250 [Spirochaetes bacterium GWB1_59_5]|nr:MAG: hypothetical protein A2Y38_02250 [Spirochaetes bacterium GWB1_59_5]
MDDKNLRTEIIRLAAEKPELRKHLLPLLRQSAVQKRVAKPDDDGRRVTDLKATLEGVRLKMFGNLLHDAPALLAKHLLAWHSRHSDMPFPVSGPRLQELCEDVIYTGYNTTLDMGRALQTLSRAGVWLSRTDIG